MYGKKIQGVKNFGNEGEGRFREILAPPPKMRVAPQMPPPPKFRDLAPPLFTSKRQKHTIYIYYFHYMNKRIVSGDRTHFHRSERQFNLTRQFFVYTNFKCGVGTSVPAKK